MKKLYGFYSATAVNAGCGSAIYRTPEGGEVEVTVVDDTMEGGSPPAYNWEGTVFVGEVTQFLRRGKEAWDDYMIDDRDDDYPYSEDEPIVYH